MLKRLRPDIRNKPVNSEALHFIFHPSYFILKIQSRRSSDRTARTATTPHPHHPYTPSRIYRTEILCPAPAQVETAGREARNILPGSKVRQVKEQRNRK
jgi:hypothetical protein